MTIIIKHKWNKKKVEKLVKFLYTAKARHDPMTQYMKNELNKETLYFLLQNPKLFANYYLYQQFIELYFPELIENHPNFTQALIHMAVINGARKQQQARQLRHQKMYEINYQRLINDTRQIRQDKRIKHTMQLNVDLNKILRETTIDLTTQHEQTIEKTIKQLNKAIEENGLIEVPNIKQNKKLQEKLTKLEKQIIRENKRLEKNKTNRVLWQKARLLDDKYKPTYKVWNQHPNPKTRHSLTNGQKVKLEEKFIVINDKTGDIDYVDYPGDWTCSPSNSANCLCSISFTNDSKGYAPPTDLKQQAKEQSQIIQKELQEKREKRRKLNEQKKKLQLNSKEQDIIHNLHKKPIEKFTHRTMEMFKKYHKDDEQIMKQVERDKNKYPEEFSKKTIFNIIKFQKFFKDDINEHAMIIDYKTGKILITSDGNPENVKIPFERVEDTGHLISVHNHPEPIENNKIQGELQSPYDLKILGEKSQEKYSVVTSEHFVSVIKSSEKLKENFIIYMHCYEITKNYFTLLQKGIELSKALLDYEDKMKKLFNEENIQYYIIGNSG